MNPSAPPASLHLYPQLFPTRYPKFHELCGECAIIAGAHDLLGVAVDPHGPDAIVGFCEHLLTAIGRSKAQIAAGNPKGTEADELASAWESPFMAAIFAKAGHVAPKARALYPGQFAEVVDAWNAGKGVIIGFDTGTVNRIAPKSPALSGQLGPGINHYAYARYPHIGADGKTALWVVNSLNDGRSRAWGTAADGVVEMPLWMLRAAAANWGAQDHIPLGDGMCKAVILQPSPIIVPPPPPPPPDDPATATIPVLRQRLQASRKQVATLTASLTSASVALAEKASDYADAMDLVAAYQDRLEAIDVLAQQPVEPGDALGVGS